MFAILLSIVLLLCFCLYTMFYSKNAKIINKIPGPNVLPCVGNSLEFLHSPVWLFYKARNVLNEYRFKDNIARFWITILPVVIIDGPEDLEIMLSSTKNIKKGYVYKFLHKWFKDGLLTSTGDKWQQRRKVLTPTFHFSILRQFCVTFVSQADTLVENLKPEVNKEIEILPYVTGFALNSICETAMGTNLDSTDDDITKYKKGIYEMGDLLMDRIIKPWVYPDWTYYNSKNGRRELGTLSRMFNFTKKVINERRVRFIQSKLNNAEDIDEVGSKRRMVMLDLLLKAEAEGEIDMEGIREEVDTFMFEGHDTTTVALTYFLMLLANHSDIQERIVREINDVVKESEGSLTIEDFNKMVYMEMCIKEALRLYPSVPIIMRKLTDDLQFTKYLVPAGTHIALFIYDIHRNPKYFPDPDRFDPERFSPENSRNRHPYAYIPFSAGPRNCIGQKFALLEEKAMVTAVLRNFKLEAVTKPDDLLFRLDIILRTETPVKIKIIPRY